MGTLLTSFGGVRSSTRMEYARLDSTHDHQRVYFTMDAQRHVDHRIAVRQQC